MKRILVMGSSRPFEQVPKRAAYMVGITLARSGFGLVSGNAPGVDEAVAHAFCGELVRLSRNPLEWFCQLRLPFLVRGGIWPYPGYRARLMPRFGSRACLNGSRRPYREVTLH